VAPNFLVVRGHPNDVQYLKNFLEQVDVPVPEVLLQAYVMEVRDAQSKDTAVQLIFSLLEGRLSGTMGTPAGDLSVLRLGGRDMALSIGRLTSDSRVRLISSPVLRASDGSVASVTIGTDTPTLGSIVTYSGTSQQSVTYQSAGVLLNISPRILQESIRLLIWQELSSFVKTDTGLATTPTKLRRAFRSDVVARHGEVILLGGLSEFNQSQIKQGGFLGLGSTSKLDSQSEIVVLLQVQRLDGKAPPPLAQ
jgi:type II secretory pathway component GspD/PulD (secretin)